MGEWSKKVGERGEELIGDFLKSIGWGSAQRGLELDCARSEKHKVGGKNRHTHGIDYLFPHRCPLIDELFQNIVISVKYSAEPYPSNPSTKFKEHFIDLTGTLECFRNSTLRRDAIASKHGVRETQDIGVLFWLSNAKNSYDDVVGRLQNINVPDDNNYRAVHLVDNKRMAFIYDALAFVRQIRDAQFQFHYHESGRNLNPLVNSKNGQVLPVEFITSPVIALRVEIPGSNDVRLMLLLDEPFDGDSLRRMIGLAQRLSGNWTRRIDICFSEFNTLEHDNEVQAVKNGFEDRQVIDAITVTSFRPSFTT